MFEDADWADFFWSSLPADAATTKTAADIDDSATPLAQSLLNAVCDLMFCPDFTVVAARRAGPDKVDELQHLDSCEYIWEAGVGFATSPARNAFLEQRRTELLKLLLCCFSETMYRPPGRSEEPNKWIAYFTSADNRHALPLFTSMLNTVCAYDPVGLGVPYNHFLFADSMEPLVEVCLQILIVTLDHDMTVHSAHTDRMAAAPPASAAAFEEASFGDNLFINYLSRVHRDEDFQFILRGISRLLNNPLAQSYLPNSTKRLHCHQELLVFFWKLCDYNKKFLYFVLKSSDVLEILVPILYHLNDSRADQCEWNGIWVALRQRHITSDCSYSARRSDAHRRVHTASAVRRAQLWCAPKQAVHGNGADGHSGVHRHARGPVDHRVPQDHCDRPPAAAASVRLLAYDSGER